MGKVGCVAMLGALVVLAACAAPPSTVPPGGYSTSAPIGGSTTASWDAYLGDVLTRNGFITPASDSPYLSDAHNSVILFHLSYLVGLSGQTYTGVCYGGGSEAGYVRIGEPSSFGDGSRQAEYRLFDSQNSTIQQGEVSELFGRGRGFITDDELQGLRCTNGNITVS